MVETVVGAALLVIVVGAAFRLLETSRDLAVSTCDKHTADARIDRGLSLIERDFRGASLETAQHLDATPFAEGDSASGFGIRPVTRWEGGAVLGDLVQYRLELPTGETEGQLIRTVGLIETTVATGVTEFVATRSGSEFTFELAARAGPHDDRERASEGTLTVMARNR